MAWVASGVVMNRAAPPPPRCGARAAAWWRATATRSACRRRRGSQATGGPARAPPGGRRSGRCPAPRPPPSTPPPGSGTPGCCVPGRPGARADGPPVTPDRSRRRRPATPGRRSHAPAGAGAVARGCDGAATNTRRYRNSGIDSRSPTPSIARPEGDVGQALLQHGRHLLARRHAERRLDGSRPRPERGEQRRGHRLGHRAGRDHPQPLRGALGLADGVLGLRRQGDHLRRDRHQTPAAGREGHPVAAPLDQGVAQLLAQRGERARHRRLAHPERPGRGRDRPEPGDEHERLELGEGHRPVTR